MNNFTARKNPYIIGRPIHEPEKFFGRETLFQFIEDSLNADTKIILLHAQRRIGISSVLQQIPHKVAQDKFVFVLFDLQGYSESSLSDVLFNLAEEIISQLELDFDIVTLSSDEELKNNPDIFYQDFLPKVYQELGDKNLVLLLDEFDIVSSDDGILNQGNSFFRYLQSLLNKQKKLFIIPVVGRSKDDLENLLDLFNRPPYQEVGFLDELSARQLITKPAQGMLEYQEDAIKAILELSSGHPYFTQAICFNLFLQAKIAEKWTVTRSDVEGIIDKTIESATGGLAWFWDGLSISEQVVFSAVAEAQKIAIEQKQSFPEDPLTLLQKYGVIPTEDLLKAAKKLIADGFIDDTKRRVNIELVRRWLIELHPLQKTIWKLEELKKKAINRIEQEAIKLDKNGKKQDAIDCYEEILKLNPNYFSTLPVLAQRYLEIGNFNKALELYQRDYKLDAIRNKEGLLLALENYGNDLISQREFAKARTQFEEALKIEPDRVSAKYKLREIEAEISQQQQLDRKAEISQEQLENLLEHAPKTSISQQILLGAIAVGTIALLVGGIGIYQSFTSCSGGQQKVYASCVSNPTITSIPNNIQSNISRGDRTFFFTIPNTSRDQGIEAFKKGNYLEAAALFQNAVKDKNNKPDPEILIYYNNAKAREKSNSLTLAVVVPADNSQNATQQILRGVAQAQNQFNANGGSNGRLLEIAIANDSNDPKKAEQVAQQLVNYKSVLGVIGHDSSDATQAALPIYKQAGIPIISSTSTANSLNGRNFFRTIPSDAASGEKLAQYAQNSALKKVVIFYNPKSTYSNSLREEFTNKFKGQIFRKIDLTDSTLNIEQELKESASQQVQAIMLFSDVDHTSRALEIAKVNANNKLGLKLLGGDSLYNQKSLNEGKKAVEGLIIAVPWFRKAPQSKKFADSAEDYWRGGVSWATATSFDATKAFIKSLSFNPSRQSILAGLPMIELSSEETSGDVLKFNKEGERQSKAILVRVENGHFQCLQCSP
ncbi:MAG: ABC transporter substrate-binding protein [Nostoc sp.]|uniref:ABC transporter substrate-binding protein n=1 Tax=Nostoc sp. TaxID=1180 RepID=UPI002FF88448